MLVELPLCGDETVFSLNGLGPEFQGAHYGRVPLR